MVSFRLFKLGLAWLEMVWFRSAIKLFSAVALLRGIEIHKEAHGGKEDLGRGKGRKRGRKEGVREGGMKKKERKNQ